jgi:CxxC motif-containing protein
MSKPDRKALICVVCPLGCKLTVERDGTDGYRVSGSRCKRGREYAIEEFTNPTRMLTSTVKMRDSRYRRLPVHSSVPLPKEKIFEAMKIINSAAVRPPVRTGDVIIASRDIEK